MIKYIASIVLVLLSVSIHGQVKTYRQLPELPISGKFKVEIKQNKTGFQQVITYGIPNAETKMVTKTEHLAMFAFEPKSGAVDIQISSLDGTKLDASNIELVNKMYTGVSVSFANGKMLLKVQNPKKQLFVRLKNDAGNPLMIFADPLQESKIPTGANVKRFTASTISYVQTAEFDRYTVPNDVDVVYIEDGALFKGNIFLEKNRTKPVMLMGRGMIMGNGPIIHGKQGIPYNSVTLNGNGHLVEGITILNSRHFGLNTGDNAHIDNVKMFGYNSNNDGIGAGENSLIENCFLKVNDDHIKLYHDNTKVRNVCFYAQTNGGIIQFAWNSIDPGDNCLVENCEVLACEYVNCGDPLETTGGLAHCFISLREEQVDGKKLVNDTIRNILIQGQLQRFIGINGYSSKGIDIDNLVLENINVVKTPVKLGWVYTKDSTSMDVKFKNVVFENRAISEMYFKTSGKVKLSFDGKTLPFKAKMN